MARRSKALETLIFWADTTRRGRHSPELPGRIRQALLRESMPGPEDPDPEVTAWRQMLAVIPLDAASFKGMYEAERGPREAESISRRKFLDDLAWCCERQMDRMSDEVGYDSPASRSLGYLAVLFLTLLTMEDADDRRFDDLADWGVVRTGPERPEQVTAAQEYASVCERLFTFDEVGEALRRLYRPDLAEHRSTVRGLGANYNPWALFEGGAPIPEDPVAVEMITAVRTDEIWAELDFDGMTFHRCGTTSFIVRTPWLAGESTRGRKDAAVKFVLLPYAELAAIERATSRYLVVYGHRASKAESAVKIWASARNLIVMDLVEGDTLAQRVLAMQADRQNHGGTGRPSTALRRQIGRVRRYLAVEDAKEGTVEQRFADSAMLLRFGRPLFDALKDLRNNNLVHQDINPSNIIVEQTADRDRLVFIDFGRNYLYDQAGLSREGADAIYIAPEIRSGETAATGDREYLPDVYSLGQLLIALSGVGRDAEGVVPDPFYRRTPLLARFLEDLIEREPAMRLLINRPDEKVNPYEYLSDVFIANVSATLEADRTDGVFGPPSPRRRLILTYGPISGAVRRLHRLQQATRGGSDPWWRASDWLYRWSVCSALMWYGCLALLLYLLVADLGWAPAGPLTALARDGYRIPPHRIGDNLTARLTGITFCLAGVKYYQNIYSNLTTRVLPEMTGRLGRFRFWTEFWVRLNALFVACVVVPVNLLQPAWWTIGSAVGLFDSLMVNFTGSLFALIAVQEARTPSATRSDHRPRLSTVPQNIPGLSMYRMWAPSMAAYVGIVLFFAVLIDTDVLHDDVAYASVVSVLNIALFYGIKCGINAEPVRIGLTRAYLAAERLGRARNAGLISESPAPADSAPVVLAPRRRERRPGNRLAGVPEPMRDDRP